MFSRRCLLALFILVCCYPLAAEISQKPPFPITCGQTLNLLGAAQAPSDPRASPAPAPAYQIKIPPCDPAESSSDFVLHLENGTLALARTHPESLSALLLQPLASPKVLVLLAVALLALAALAYALYALVLLPLLGKLIAGEVALKQKLGEASGLAIQTSSAERPTGRQAETLTTAAIAGQISRFRDTEFQQLAARVSRLETPQSSPTPITRTAKQEPESSPPIVMTPRLSEPERFVVSYNRALTDPALRDQFAKRYKPRVLALTNSIEVTRSKERPVFAFGDAGDFLVVPTRDVGNEWAESSYYLVPLYDKRWTNDRITQGAWNFFFEVNSEKGVNELIQPAVVKQGASSWEIADENARGEIAWDPNAAN